MFFRRCVRKKKTLDLSDQIYKKHSESLSFLDAQSCARRAVTSKKNYVAILRYVENEQSFLLMLSLAFYQDRIERAQLTIDSINNEIECKVIRRSAAEERSLETHSSYLTMKNMLGGQDTFFSKLQREQITNKIRQNILNERAESFLSEQVLICAKIVLKAPIASVDRSRLLYFIEGVSSSDTSKVKGLLADLRHFIFANNNLQHRQYVSLRKKWKKDALPMDQVSCTLFRTTSLESKMDTKKEFLLEFVSCTVK